MKLRGEDGTREACSAACQSPASCVAVSCRQREMPQEQPAERLQLADSSDRSAQLPELLFDTFVTTIHVIDPIDDRLTFRRETGEHESG